MQREFLKNFFKLCQNYNKIVNLAAEKNISNGDLFRKMDMYDVAVISRLETCAQKPITPINDTYNQYLQGSQYGICSVPNLTKEYFYLQMLDDL